jgi:succinate dehydrogenase hydrophobic anchor subunit
VIDTSWAAFYPDLYKDAIAQYQSPLFTIGEFALVACVIFHAYNGLRIIVLDYKPEWWEHQARASTYVFLATFITLIPTFGLMFNHVLNFYEDDPETIGLQELVSLQSKFLLGFVVIIMAALALSFLYGLITRSKTGLRMPGRMEATMWSFMRLSGILIVPLVFGHLALMHVVQGVFDITSSGTVVGTAATNDTATAVEFVGERWDYLLAGVAFWRVYDGLLLALVVIHGFNGLRYVVNDYAHHPTVNRALNWAIVFGMVALIVLGVAALIAGVDETAYDIVQNSAH